MNASVSAQPTRWPGGAHARRLASSPALRVSGRRLLSAIPVLWGVTFLTFLTLNALPGDAASALLGINATPAEIRAFSIKLHLNEPLWVRYGHWLGGVLTGNLGTSLASPQSVASILGQRVPVTLELIIYAMVMTLAVSVPLAVLCARRPRGIIDRLSMVAAMGSISVAPYVLALLLVIVFAVDTSIFPAIGYQSIGQGLAGNLRDVTLPCIVLALPLIGFYTRLLRADLLEQMQFEDYIVTARAKGVSEWRVLTRHALRNSFIGLLTVIGLNLATLIGATVIVEQIFSLPGIGYELLQAISNRDVPVIEGIVLVFGAAVVLANLATDLLYGVLDPGSGMSVPAADIISSPLPAAADRQPASPAARGWLRSAEIAVPGAMLAILLFFCFVWPIVYPVPPPVGGSLLTTNLPLWSPGHIFGTDIVGDDVMARILYGGRVSFEVAAAVQVIGGVIGGTLGMAAAYRGGIVEAAAMRALDVFIAFPSLVLVLAIADSLGPSETHVIWALSAFSIPAFARVARAATLRLREQPFVLAARLSGTRTWRILLQHIAPNMAPQMLTFGLLGAGVVIILEGALDFLGYGIPPPTASWGNMIAAGQSFISVSPRFVVVPSIFLLLAVLTLNLLGDGLRARWGVR